MNASTDSNEADSPPSPAGALALPVTAKPLALRIVGIGGAGGNAVAHMANSDLAALRPVALHTSARILEMTSAPEKILLGASLMHGLGAGGDPSVAREAAEKDLAVLRNLCTDVDLLFIVVGLGGGTGTGIAPVLSRVAKEAGVLVAGVATLPFEIEGPRRQRQAQQGLREFRAAADTVICLPNQKIFRIVDENTSVLDTFKITNELLAQGIRGIWQMLTRPSLIHVDFAHLGSLLRDRHAESSFATVSAQGEGRARDLIDQLLACPLLDGGQTLSDADAVLVNLVGGADLSMADVKRVMEELNRRTDNAQLMMSASVVDELQGKLGLTVFMVRRSSSEESDTSFHDRRMSPGMGTGPIQGTRSSVSPPAESAGSRFTPGGSTLTLEPPLDGSGGRTPHPPGGVRFSPRKLQQGNLPLDIISKGRFEKSHPTLHRGEDLDIPTYVRRGIPLN